MLAAAARRAPAFLLITTLLCALTLSLGYANKARCVGPSFDQFGRSGPAYQTRIARDVCYSDIQFLWIGRDIDRHVFPYVSGGYNAIEKSLYGGSLEYPVLTGLAIWLAAIPSSTDGDFLLYSAVLLAAAGLLAAALLAWLAGVRSWWYALAPPLVLYAFHNWDLLAVAATVVAFFVLLRASRPLRDGAAAGEIAPPGRISRPGPLVAAAAALGIGAGFKLYPMMFALPIALWLGAGGWKPSFGNPRPVFARWMVAIAFAAGTALVFVLVNVPFVLAGPRGWWASFQFQWSRPIDVTTNTIWFWGARPYSDSDNESVQHTLAMIATGTTLAALLLACVLGFLRYDRRRGYPWLQVCAAMVCGYLLFNKVHSPQFTLWLLPFFVLLRIRPGWILAYFVADAAVGIGFFRWQYLIGMGAPSSAYDALSPQLVLIGVWGRAALLVALFIVFLRSEVVSLPPRWRRQADGSGADRSRVGSDVHLRPAADLADRHPDGAEHQQPVQRQREARVEQCADVTLADGERAPQARLGERPEDHRDQHRRQRQPVPAQDEPEQSDQHQHDQVDER